MAGNFHYLHHGFGFFLLFSSSFSGCHSNVSFYCICCRRSQDAISDAIHDPFRDAIFRSRIEIEEILVASLLLLPSGWEDFAMGCFFTKNDPKKSRDFVDF